MHPQAESDANGGALARDRSLATALADYVSKHAGTATVVSGSAEEILGATSASSLGWKDCTLVRLPGSNGEIAGVLALSGRPPRARSGRAGVS